MTYTGTGNRTPLAIANANSTSGAAPLSVNFNAAGSSDPDGDTLTYDWNFGDGAPHSAAVAPTHLYAAGTYTATLLVSDGKGGSASASVRIDSGNTAPVPQIDGLSADFRFHVGQTIELQGSADDAQDGALAPSQLSWRAILHHNDHTHPYAGPIVGSSITLTAPAPEDLAATAHSYLEIQLSAADSHGLTSVITRELRPKLVNITFATTPAGLPLTVNDTPVVGPQTLVSWEGYALAVAAPAHAVAAGRSWSFAHWSDGGAATHTIVTPAAPATYAATFASVADHRYFLPFIDKL